MVDNPNKYSEMGTGSSLGDIRDDDDFPHAGIIKALSDGLGQNYAISGFAATNISATSVDIAAGKIMRDGKIVDVAGATLTIAAAGSGTGNTYSMLVAPASGAVTRIQGTVKGKTPTVPAGNTVIGVLVHTGSTMQLQYLTVDKSENHLSIARDNGGTYTQGLTIKSNTGDIEIEALEQDKDIIFKANDGGASTEIMRIDSSVSRVGIGTTTPNAKLHITDSGSGDHLILEGTLGSSTTSAPNLVLFRNGADAAADIDDNDLIGQIVFRGENDNSTPQEVNYATIEAGMDDTTDGSEDGHITFNLIEAGVLTEFMRLRAATRDVVVNEQADDIDFRCEGSSDANLLFVDADANKVGIGLNTPKTKLTVEGAITLKEQVNADADTAAYGQLWTKTATPNELYFTNDAGNDIQLTTGAKGPLLQGKHSIWIPAEAISPRSNAGCADLTLTPAATNGRPDIRGLAFDGATREHAQFTIAMPKMWDGGDVTARFYWTTIASGTGNVMWGIRGVSLSDNDAIDTGFGSLAVTAPDGVLATKDVHITDESGACTIGGSPAALDICCFQVVRESDQSNDTLNSVDCVLLGVKLFYTIDKGNDA